MRDKRTLSTIALSLAIALGAVTLHDRLALPADAQTTTAAQGSAPSFNPSRARTENERNTVQVVQQAQSGVVYVSTESRGGAASSADADPFAGTPFQNMPGLPRQLQQGPQRGTGSGFFIDAQGDILTNNHVVQGADTIKIRLFGSKTTYTAKVIGRAPDYDLALIRAQGVPANLIKPLALGDSSQLAVGLKAVAMGAPFDLDFSVTEGIISALNRKIEVGAKNVPQPVIQTDAAINPGNSGGPLLDSNGQVIGVNTQILTGGAEQNAGVGFAIPVNTVKALLPRLREGGQVKTPTLGIQFTDLSVLDAATAKKLRLPTQGALVSQVLPGSPAQKAGLKGGTNQQTVDGAPFVTGGDIITAVGGQRITEASDLQEAVLDHVIGDSVTLTVQRDGKARTLTVKLFAYTAPTTGQVQPQGR